MTFGDDVVAEMPKLRRFAMKLTRGDASRADDLLQDALARALAKSAQYEPGTNLWAWLASVMYSVFVNGVRRSVREGVPVMTDGNPALEYDWQMVVPPSQEGGLLFSDVVAAFAALPQDMRDALMLVAVEGLTYEAAAELLRVPVGTVRSRLSRGRDKLALDSGYRVSHRRQGSAGR